MKMELKKPSSPTRKSKEYLTNRMNQAEDRIWGLEDKIEDLSQIIKEHKKLGKNRKC